MRMIAPFEVTDASLISSTVPENTQQWNATKTYAKDDKVLVLSQHKIYQALQPNTGIDPTSGNNVNWLEVGASNRWKAFDEVIGDSVEHTTDAKYVIATGKGVTGVAAFGLSGDSIRVIVTDPTDGEVYNKQVLLNDTSNVVDWFSFYFGEALGTSQSDVLFSDIPPYSQAEVKIVVKGTNVKIGQLVIGRDQEIGVTNSSTTLGVEDYSKIERDPFGRASITERAYASTVEYKFTIPTKSARWVRDTIAARRAHPTVYYTCAERADLGTLLYGLAQPLSIVLKVENYSPATMKVESLV